MNQGISSEFDPFRVLVSFASEADSADLFIETFTGVGLTFDLDLTSSENFSHSTRSRALRPRVLAAYDALSAAGRLAAASAALGRFNSRYACSFRRCGRFAAPRLRRGAVSGSCV